MDEATLRINLFFYRFGAACLGLALLVKLGQHAVLRGSASASRTARG